MFNGEDSRLPAGPAARLLARLLTRPVWVLLPVACLVILGIAGFHLMPVAMMPEMEFPTIVVDAQLPGASSETVAATLTTPLERSLRNLPYLLSISSESSLGQSELTLQFSIDRSLDAASSDVQRALATAAPDLPADMSVPPQFQKANPTVASVVFVSFSSTVLSAEQVSSMVERVARPMLRSVPGVGDVVIYGARNRAINVTADLQKLDANRLTLEDIRAAVNKNSLNRPKGVFETDTRRTVISADDQRTS